MYLYILILALLFCFVICVITSAKKRAESQQLQQYKLRLELIHKLTNSINSQMSSDDILQVSLQLIADVFPNYRVSYSTISEQGHLEVCACVFTANLPSIKGVSADLSVAPEYLQRLNVQKVLAVPDVFAESYLMPLKQAFQAGNTRAILDVAISHNDHFVGLFCIDAATQHNWTQHEIKVLSEVAEYLEIAIRQAQFHKEQQQMAAKLAEYNHDLEAKVAERTSQLEKAKQQAETLAMTDELTQLPNRRAFFIGANKLHLQAKRHGRPFSLLIFDIDKFKLINDNFGHGIGDNTLQMLGQLLLPTLRKSDILGRLGGEEFALALPETNLDEASQFAERLRVLVAENQLQTEKGPIKITVSVGVATYAPTDDLDAVMARADDALYQAKEQGRNRVVSQQLSDTPGQLV